MAYHYRLLLLLGLGACVDLSRPPGLVSDLDAPAGKADRPDLPPAADGSEAGADAPPRLDSEPAGDALGPDGMPAPDAALLPNGRRCSSADQCSSGLCVDGHCCDLACAGPCQACHLAGSEGRCLPVPAGQDLRDSCAQEPASSCGRDGTCDGQGACRRYGAGTECAPGSCNNATEQAASTCDGAGNCRPGSSKSCAPNMCTGGSCAASCASNTDCQTGFFCDGNRCSLRRVPGSACTSAGECASGMCIDGVCCSSPCGQLCHACNVAGALGTCTPIANGQDPQAECPLEAASSCGRAGGCNGAGACRLHASGTSCASRSCNGFTETAGSSCNGAGVCVAGGNRDCSPYLCNGTACGTTCTNSSQCKSSHYCSGGACLPFGAGPQLYWRFDETTGTSALDTSGNALHGTYTGTTGTPTTSTSVPLVHFADPASRAFNAANRQAVRLAAAPSAIKPTKSLTLSLWFRATALDTGHNPPASSEAVSLGDNYFIRIRADDVAFTRRTATGYASCFGVVSGHLDDRWHHVAGVFSGTGMKVYVDGAEKCSNTRGEDLVYDKGPDLFVGRHGDGQTQWDFGGNLDDLRIYNRALPPDEVAALAAGF